jgi:hypothetical protein
MSGTTEDLHRRSAALLEQMLGDPRTAERAEDLVKTLNPTAVFPLRERREALMAPLMTELEKERARVAALEEKWKAREEAEAAREAKQAEAALLARMENVKKQRGLSDDMMERVMQRMRDNNNPDVESAAAFVADSLPKPPPAAGYDYMPDTLDPYGTHSGDEKWAALRKDPKDWQTNEVKSILRDPEFLRLGNV